MQRHLFWINVSFFSYKIMLNCVWQGWTNIHQYSSELCICRLSWSVLKVQLICTSKRQSLPNIFMGIHIHQIWMYVSCIGMHLRYGRSVPEVDKAFQNLDTSMYQYSSVLSILLEEHGVNCIQIDRNHRNYTLGLNKKCKT